MTRQYIPIDEVLRALSKHPDGLTTRELAERLGLKPANVASRLSKAFMYGVGIEREFRNRSALGRRECIWRLTQ